ncbi:uncharacterized protein ColSpa_09868 [Colletotrichum spaethianum]|uniref:Uncharacterized protein n=1 Tax=Colletotrichum spaethianum TaxID=700344 RepID=A0AA37PCI0_9PEZI|nr:uncharacterized protein ColSpa_09868 [Colletotrichum spaethianum]GKT49687.1 hypothetical protein ColSpa_09868 [Colletotrichum spaethianum]
MAPPLASAQPEHRTSDPSSPQPAGAQAGHVDKNRKSLRSSMTASEAKGDNSRKSRPSRRAEKETEAPKLRMRTKFLKVPPKVPTGA